MLNFNIMNICFGPFAAVRAVPGGASVTQRLLPIVGVGLQATQMISRQRSFMTTS